MGFLAKLGITDITKTVEFIIVVILVIVVYIVLNVFKIREKMRKIYILDTDFENPNYVRKTRRQLMRFVIWSFIIIFLIALLSIGTLTYMLIPLAWAPFFAVFWIFLKVWKYHGYSALVLIAATAVVAVLSFLITLPLRNYIEITVLNYIHNKT